MKEFPSNQLISFLLLKSLFKRKMTSVLMSLEFVFIQSITIRIVQVVAMLMLI